MARKSKKDITHDFIRKARERYKLADDGWREIKREALEDLKFVDLGEQWDGNVMRQREGRPCIIENHMPSFVDGLIGQLRQNKPGIKVRPVDSAADKDVASIYEGLIRNIEYVSNAEYAYLHAGEMVIKGGLGAWRVNTRYSTDDGWEQDIVIERIKNPFTVSFDPTCTQPDFSDAEYCFVGEWIEKSEFERLYPGASATSMNSSVVGEASELWYADGKVRVVEYWYKEYTDAPLLLLGNGETVTQETYDQYIEEYSKNVDAYQQALAEGMDVPPPPPLPAVIRKRIVKRPVVKWCKMSADDILDEGVWAGSYIPVILVTGKEGNIDGKPVYRSLIKWGKEAQRIYNYMLSSMIEQVALAPKAPWLLTKDAIEGHEVQWKSANALPYPYLVYNEGADKPERQMPVPTQPGLSELVAQSAGAMQSTIGIVNVAAFAGNDSSKAINATMAKGDVSSFPFIDNLARGINLTGRILIDLIPKIYDTQRIVRVIGIDGQSKSIEVNRYNIAIDHIENDLSVGKYDCVVTTAPSYATQRMEMAIALTELLKSAPQLMQVMGDIYFASLDLPGAEIIAERFRRTMPPQITGEENPTPDPMQGQAQALEMADKASKVKLNEAKAQNMQAQAEMMNAKAQSEPGMSSLY